MGYTILDLLLVALSFSVTFFYQCSQKIRKVFQVFTHMQNVDFGRTLFITCCGHETVVINMSCHVERQVSN